MGHIIDGKGLAKQVRRELKQRVQQLADEGIVPGLAVVLVGDDPASAVYVRNKTRACRRVGMACFDHLLPADTDQRTLLDLVHGLNSDPQVHGILVQMPLPPQIDEAAVIDAIAPEKDADGFHPINVGRLLAGQQAVAPCTPLGIMRILREQDCELVGKRALVIGRSNTVGKPMALLLLAEHCTVTIAHSRTRDLPQLVSESDIVVAAVGRPEVVRGSWIKPGAIVIDVGINRVDGKLVGDVEFAAAADRAAAITPVPGGVGPMTVATLLVNTVELAIRARSHRD